MPNGIFCYWNLFSWIKDIISIAKDAHFIKLTGIAYLQSFCAITFLKRLTVRLWFKFTHYITLMLPPLNEGLSELFLNDFVGGSWRTPRGTWNAFCALSTRKSNDIASASIRPASETLSTSTSRIAAAHRVATVRVLLRLPRLHQGLLWHIGWQQ